MTAIRSFYDWLHGKWPAGLVEKLPEVGEHGLTAIAGVRIVGDLTGIPLLKFSSDTGAKAVQSILTESDFAGEREKSDDETYDVAIIGGGVSGFSAAIEAKKAGLSYILFESSQSFSTVENFPKGKPIFTYPTDLTPAGGINYDSGADTREALLEDMKRQVAEANVAATEGMIQRVEKKGNHILLHHSGKDQKSTKALRCIIAIGRSGNYRKMGIPGEDLTKVSNRLFDPKEFEGKKVTVVGGGDSAAEAAISMVENGADVTISYRKAEFNRPKPENVARVNELASQNKLSLKLATNPTKITEDSIILKHKDGSEESIPNDNVLAALGREAPLDFFRRSGLRITGERNRRWWTTVTISVLLMTWIYHWKKDLFKGTFLDLNPEWLTTLLPKFGDGHLMTTLASAMESRGFYYSFAYCLIIIIFGLRRIQRRKTPYVKRQTISLAVIQCLPLFLLPYIILPWAGANGWFADGSPLAGFADLFFEKYDETGHNRAYWRAFGLILAWPLFFFNVFTDQPMIGWLIVSLIQTFVIIPWIVRKWGKGAYCGWICSCGALAETLGDAHRHKMPHGPIWNKLNMIGQVFLWAAFVLLFLRILGWWIPAIGEVYKFLFTGAPLSQHGLPGLNYNYFVDLIWAGIMGVAFYFHFSGRVWCRFACPLAALMHLYQRSFGKFRIFSDKKKCISCNVCTSVCHQGIDIMNFANKGKPMEDPECVRCSACVQQCPTGVLSFGRFTDKENKSFLLDRIAASPVQMKESKKQ